MSLSVLVVAEHKGSTIRRVTLEAIAVAQQLLQQQNGSVHCFLSGDTEAAELQQAAKQLLDYGATKVHLASNISTESEQTTTQGVQPSTNSLTALAPLKLLVSELQPTFIIAGHTAYGRELAPRLAAALGSGYIADVTGIQWSGPSSKEWGFTRPIYAGKAFETRQFSGNAPYLLTIRPNNHETASSSSATDSSVSSSSDHSSANQTDGLTSRDEEAAIAVLPSAPTSLRFLIKETVARVSSSIDLTEANIIVAGGRGVRGSEGFQLLQQLAEQLGGAVGASRAACDAGYCDYSLQIGQTGKVVTPQLYIACGISGAIQHLAGMSQSRTIIAINKDSEAPIFSVADYGIVGDLFEIVPLLIKELQALR